MCDSGKPQVLSSLATTPINPNQCNDAANIGRNSYRTGLDGADHVVFRIVEMRIAFLESAE